MAIKLGDKGATINGIYYPRDTYILGLARDQEALLAQGGDAVDVPNAAALDWILNGAGSGAASAWIPFRPGQRIAYGLDSGSVQTTAAVDYSFDGGMTPEGQAYTISYASSAIFEVGTLLVSPYFVALATAAKNSGRFTGYFYRVTVTSGGPLSVLNNV